MRQRRSREYAKLDRMVAYTTAPCRRRYVVEYFGEVAPFEQCGTCDACRSGTESSQIPRSLTPDETLVVLKLVSCLARMERKANKKGWSVDLLAKTATGSKESKVVQWGFDMLTTHGILGAGADGSRWTVRELHDLTRSLVEAGVVDETYITRRISGKERTYKEITVSDLGWLVLRRAAPQLQMVFPHAHKLVRRRPIASPNGQAPTALLAILRDVRSEMASKHEVPPYVVASNKTLDDMARLRPLTRKAMLGVHGMGEKRFRRYGGAFMSVIRDWASQAT
jgi:ATP-dependent DNA helicase RecQ